MATRAQWDGWLLVGARWFTVLALPLMILGPAPIDIAVSLVAVLYLVRSALVRDWAWTKETWVRILILLWLYSLFTCFFAQEMEPAFKRILPWLRYIVLAPALAFWVLGDEKTEKHLFWALLGTVAFLCFDTLLQFKTGTDLFGRKVATVTGQIRLSGPFSNPRVGITLTWIMFPLLCFLMARGSFVHRLFAAGFTAIAVVVVFATGERMAFLLAGMGCVLSFLLVPRARLPLFVAGIIGALALVAVIEMRPGLKDRQIGQSSAEITGFWQSSYGQLWLSSLKMVEKYPFTGVGPRNFRNRCPEAKFGSTTEEALFLRCPVHPHNNYMEWLAETGLIGFGLYVAFAFSLILKLWEQRRLVYSDALLGGLVVTLAIRLWPLSATTSQFSPWSAAPFWILTGWMLARLVAPKKI